jgi:hypothetical protein
MILSLTALENAFLHQMIFTFRDRILNQKVAKICTANASITKFNKNVKRDSGHMSQFVKSVFGTKSYLNVVFVRTKK